jgi:hypothetical protein
VVTVQLLVSCMDLSCGDSTVQWQEEGARHVPYSGCYRLDGVLLPSCTAAAHVDCCLAAKLTNQSPQLERLCTNTPSVTAVCPSALTSCGI